MLLNIKDESVPSGGSNAHLSNVTLAPIQEPSVAFRFPGYDAEVRADGLIRGSSNYCLFFVGPGGCFFSGNASGYSGTFDGHTLDISGYYYQQDFFEFRIVAQAVPLPPTGFLLLSIALIMRCFIRDQSTVSS